MPGARINQVDRDRIIDAYIEGRDYIELADTLNINQRTAYRIVLAFKRSGRRNALRSGGAPPRKITYEMVEETIRFIELKPTATLEEMRSFLLEKFNIALSTTTIMRHLDGAMITLKAVRTVPFQWNSEDVKEARLIFANWMMATGVASQLVYTDECGFNIWTARNQGRSARGCRAVRMVEGQRGRNLTVCLAVSPQFGLVHHSIVNGGMTKETYGMFLSEVSALIGDDQQIVIIHDNAPSHRNCPFLNELHTVLPLPRYSPFLNITENAISCLKSAVKRQISSREVQIQFANGDAARQEGITLQELRLRILTEKIQQNINVITREKCAAWFGHSLTYIDRCRAKADITC